MSKSALVFDRLIIGSSPIAVMHAVRFSRQGDKVVLIDSEKSLGGAWKKISVEGLGETECACHLIEFQGNVYRLIEDLIGVRFVPLHPQPVKIHLNGRTEKYTSRRSILKTTLNEWLMVTAVFLIRILGIDRAKNTKLAELFNNACFAFRYRVVGLWRFRGVEGPQGGFKAFAKGLHDSLNQHRVTVISGRARSIIRDRVDRLSVLLEDGSELAARQLYLSESVNLREVPTWLPQRQYHPKPYWHLIVSSKKENVVELNHYIHLANDSVFHRITSLQIESVECGEYRQFFLVQTRIDPEQLSELHHLLCNVLVRSRILKIGSMVDIHKVFNEKWVGNESDAQFIPGVYCGSVHVMKTIGDLARCVIKNPALINTF
jgi:hypothetical protein